MANKMDCAQVDRDDVIDRYLAVDDLDATDVVLFELHYFGCPECFERLEAASLIRAALTKTGVAPCVAIPIHRSHHRRSPLRWLGVAVAAAAIAFAFYFDGLSDRVIRPRAPSTLQTLPDLAELAIYTPPSYSSISPTAPETPLDADFHEAMTSYSHADYTEASLRLQALLVRDPGYTPARFFLGASDLLLHQPDAAIEQMTVVLEDAHTPFAEEAHWCIAKAWLSKGGVVQARRELTWLVARGGRSAVEANRLLERLGK